MALLVPFDPAGICGFTKVCIVVDTPQKVKNVVHWLLSQHQQLIYPLFIPLALPWGLGYDFGREADGQGGACRENGWGLKRSSRKLGTTRKGKAGAKMEIGEGNLRTREENLFSSLAVV